MNTCFRLSGFLLLLATSTVAWGQVDVASFIKRAEFESIKISPSGDYYAAVVPMEGRAAIAIMRRADNTLANSMAFGKNNYVSQFDWVSNDRILISTSRKFGALDNPQLTGNLYAASATGGAAELLVGQDVNVQSVGTKIQNKRAEMVAAFLVDELAGDDKNVLISVQPFNDEPFTRVEKMDVYTGRRTIVAKAPVRNASFMSDNSGVVRFARGLTVDNAQKLYLRSAQGEDWKLVNDEAVSNRAESPLGFSTDNQIAYLQVEHADGPDSIISLSMVTGERKQLLRDNDTDPYRIVVSPGSSVPVGVIYMDGKPRTEFFDPQSKEARLQKSLEAAFAPEVPRITSATRDGNLALVHVSSDQNPGDLFVFDTVAKKAAYVVSERSSLDPKKMATVKPVSVTARDGMVVHGYLTVPSGSSGKSMPMVVMPHGGPYGIFDVWGWESETQLLAAAGYTVLQLNYRGSGNHGRSFHQAGAREWGGTMQDDLTDATRWAIQQGIADGNRICMYGGSYGAYASLMGVAREPELYKCAVGYVGVYDLPVLQADTKRESTRLGNWSKEWLGDNDNLAKASPNRIAGQIKVPVFLAAGGEDETAPIEHSRKMERALMAAGVPVETLYFDTEGHGFFIDAHRKEFYTKLLNFLSANIGGAKAN